jgi:hypothetical protein
MSQIGFYRALLWLPMFVPAILAPLWLVPGAADSQVIGPPLYIVTFGAILVGVPYAMLGLRTDRWLRRTPHPEPAAIWHRALKLPLQLAPLYVVWQAILGVIGIAISGDISGAIRETIRDGSASAASILVASLIAAVWVIVVGYAYVGLACGVTRFAIWAGCVRAPTHASAT